MTTKTAEKDVACLLARIADSLEKIAYNTGVIARNTNLSPTNAGLEGVIDAIDRQGPNVHQRKRFE